MNPFSDQPADTIAACGEQNLLARIRRWLGAAMPAAPHGMGDDCAVLPFSPRRPAKAKANATATATATATAAARRQSLVTVDPVIYREHFDDTIAPRSVGQKLLSRNLSDIAAMGGRPTAAVLALALDPRTRLDWLEGFYRGLGSTARRHGVPIVGGDLATHRGGIVASLTLLGETTCARALTRAGARAGDFIAVTGVLGGSLASGHHWKFTPRLAEGAWLAARREVTSMTDVSDGIAKDVFSLVPPGARPLLFAETLPVRRGCALPAALGDGEDYELLFTIRGTPATAAKLLADWGEKFPRTHLAVIGQFAPASTPASGEIDLSACHGFEHFR